MISTMSQNVQICHASCCNADSHKNQPNDNTLLHATSKTYIVKGKEVVRSFRSAWFQQYPWLTLCSTRNKVFCYVCRSQKPFLVTSKNIEELFIKNGFDNWKKAHERFDQHQLSHCHKEAAYKAISRHQTPMIEMLSKEEMSAQESHRDMFRMQLESLRYLLRQGIAIRGHHEEESNLFQLMKLQLRGKSNMALLKNYHSPEIINELISMMGQHISRDLIADVKKAN